MTQRKNTAVSPVIGVMLLLIMTVLLVAVVSSYAGSLTETRNKFPQILINPEIYKDGSQLHMNIDVLSAGDGIPTNDLKILTEWKSGGKSVSGGDMDNRYPMGRGAGVNGNEGADFFGNYTLLGGTLMYIDDPDGAQVLFGKNYQDLHENDLVTLILIHIPSQSIIAKHEIPVGKV